MFSFRTYLPVANGTGRPFLAPAGIILVEHSGRLSIVPALQPLRNAADRRAGRQEWGVSYTDNVHFPLIGSSRSGVVARGAGSGAEAAGLVTGKIKSRKVNHRRDNRSRREWLNRREGGNAVADFSVAVGSGSLLRPARCHDDAAIRKACVPSRLTAFQYTR